MSKRSRRRASMRADTTGGPWLMGGYGNDNRRLRRIERRIRERRARREAREEGR